MLGDFIVIIFLCLSPSLFPVDTKTLLLSALSINPFIVTEVLLRFSLIVLLTLLLKRPFLESLTCNALYKSIVGVVGADRLAAALWVRGSIHGKIYV